MSARVSLTHTRQIWETLGEADPLWAVLSTPGTRDGAWDVPWFLETGRIDLAAVLRLTSAADVHFGRRALDFGCGVGRVTQALAAHVDEVVGVDLAESMIRLARELNQLAERVRFVHNDDERLPFDDDSFDSALSLMVLQHLRPALAIRAILELLRVVRPGGILALQIPSHPLIPAALPAAACRARITVLAAPSALPGGAAAVVRAVVTNTGGGTWPTGRSVRLANHWLLDGVVAGGDDGRAELPHTVEPGESVELELRVAAPAQPGDYELELDLVQEFVTWFAELGSPPTRIAVRVSEPDSAPAPPGFDLPQPVADPPAEQGGSAQHAVRDSAIEMHPLPETFVRALCEQLGARVLAVGEDELAGPGWASRTYLLTAG